MKKLVLHDKTFELLVPYEKINERVVELAGRINRDYKDKDVPLFLGVLNGAFMFMGELMRYIDFDCEISFVKMSSYKGACSSGKVSELIGLQANLEGRHIIVVEDIVDTGNSIDHIMRSLVGHKPASIEIATLLLKPDAYKKDVPIKYAALSVPNDFIIGFGLDYDQLGRNYPDFYKEVEE